MSNTFSKGGETILEGPNPLRPLVTGLLSVHI